MKHNDSHEPAGQDGVDREAHDDSEVFITLSPVALIWSAWVPWSQLQRDISNQDAISLPDRSGVYEMKYSGRADRLAIGAADNLRSYVQQGLIQRHQMLSDGRHPREYEDILQVEIRWAVVESYDLAEEELLVRHLASFGYLPKYTRLI